MSVRLAARTSWPPTVMSTDRRARILVAGRRAGRREHDVEVSGGARQVEHVHAGQREGGHARTAGPLRRRQPEPRHRGRAKPGIVARGYSKVRLRCHVDVVGGFDGCSLSDRSECAYHHVPDASAIEGGQDVLGSQLRGGGDSPAFGVRSELGHVVVVSSCRCPFPDGQNAEPLATPRPDHGHRSAQAGTAARGRHRPNSSGELGDAGLSVAAFDPGDLRLCHPVVLPTRVLRKTASSSRAMTTSPAATVFAASLTLT